MDRDLKNMCERIDRDITPGMDEALALITRLGKIPPNRARDLIRSVGLVERRTRKIRKVLLKFCDFNLEFTPKTRRTTDSFYRESWAGADVFLEGEFLGFLASESNHGRPHGGFILFKDFTPAGNIGVRTKRRKVGGKDFDQAKRKFKDMKNKELIGFLFSNFNSDRLTLGA